MPALLETISMAPKVSATLATAAATSRPTETSAETAIAFRPRAESSAARFSAASRRRSTIATLPPRSAISVATAAPMPSAPPVTSAVLPANSVEVSADMVALLHQGNRREVSGAHKRAAGAARPDRGKVAFRSHPEEAAAGTTTHADQRHHDRPRPIGRAHSVSSANELIKGSPVVERFGPANAVRPDGALRLLLGVNQRATASSPVAPGKTHDTAGGCR